MALPYLPILFESFWRDEAFSVLIARHQPLQIIQLMMKDQSPPLYFLLLHYWMQWFGIGEAPVRMLSYILFLGILVATFVFSWKIMKTIPGRLVFLGLLYLNPFLLQYAFEARPYALFAFTTIVAAAALGFNQLFIASIFLALGILSHNFAVFVTAAIFVWFVWTRYKTWKTSIKDFFLLFTLPALTFLAWSGAIFQQVARVSASFWITEKTSAMYYYLFTSFTTGSIWFKTHDILQFFSVTLLVLGAAPLIMSFIKKETISPWTKLAVCISLIPIICTYIVSHFKTPIYYDRYLIASLPFVFLLMAQGIEKLIKEGSIAWKIFLCLFVYAYALSLLLAYQDIQQASTKPAINWAVGQALQRAKPQDMIISESDLNFLETKWYTLNNPLHIKAHIVSPSGTIPYYIGAAAIEPGDVIKSIPPHTTVWVIQQNGGYHKEVTK